MVQVGCMTLTLTLTLTLKLTLTLTLTLSMCLTLTPFTRYSLAGGSGGRYAQRLRRQVLRPDGQRRRHKPPPRGVQTASPVNAQM